MYERDGWRERARKIRAEVRHDDDDDDDDDVTANYYTNNNVVFFFVWYLKIQL